MGPDHALTCPSRSSTAHPEAGMGRSWMRPAATTARRETRPVPMRFLLQFWERVRTKVRGTAFLTRPSYFSSCPFAVNQPGGKPGTSGPQIGVSGTFPTAYQWYRLGMGVL